MTLVNVNLADAHNAFVSYIAAANQHHTDLEVLDDVRQEKVDRIAQYQGFSKVGETRERRARRGKESQSLLQWHERMTMKQGEAYLYGL